MKIQAQLRGNVYKTALFSVIALCLGLTPLNAGILFNNFGSGDTYDTSSGWSIGYGAASGNSGYSQALQFTPALSGTLSAVAVALLQGGGSNSTVNGSLMSDDNNQPGSLIETFAFSGISSAGGIYSVPSVAQPMLTAGTSYWFVVAAPDPINDMFLWYRNPAAPPALNGQRVGSGPWVTGPDYQGTLKLSTPDAPEITQQPQNQPVAFGENAAFTVTAAGAPPLTYQWQLNGSNLDGATNSILTVALYGPDQLTNAYDVVVTNSYGSAMSQTAGFTLIPYVFAQPQSQTALLGTNVTFSVGAVGADPLNYQWRFNGMPLADPLATNSVYPIFGAAFTDSGSYDVIVANASGAVTSQVAVLSVRDFTQPVIQPPDGSNFVAQCTSPAGATVNFTVTATDLYDPAPAVTCTPASGSVFPVGYSTVTCVATDSFGNTTMTNLTVHVTGNCDDGWIAMNCPSNLVVNLGAAPTIAVDFSVAATNLYTGQAYPVQCTLRPGSQFPVGTNLVTCVASRGGASNVCTFGVVVQDVDPPVLLAPSVLSVRAVATNLQGHAGAYVYYQPVVSDNTGVALSFSTPPGSFFDVGTNTVTIFALDPSGNLTTKDIRIVVNPFDLICGDPNADNWGFENPCLTGWTNYGFGDDGPLVTGDYLTVKHIPELVSQLSMNIGGDYWRDLYYSPGQKGSNWICTAHQWSGTIVGDDWADRDDRLNDALTGTLVSKSFTIQHDYISFLIGGGNDPDNLRVELLVQAPQAGCGPRIIPVNIDGTNYCPAWSSTGHDRELMRREWWDVSWLRGATARICIVDNSASNHLNVDDFRFDDNAPTNLTVTLGGGTYPAVIFDGSYYYDWDSPVWGFTDTHTHPMGYLGFGQRTLHGAVDGVISNALASCDDGSFDNDHGGYDWGTQFGDYWRNFIIGKLDREGLDAHGAGWDANPTNQFNKWPVFTSGIHQQMWWEWIKRAYDGGLRVMVALAENNELTATAVKAKPNAPRWDLEAGDLEIWALVNFVSRHSDFMEIAYNPYQLRDIVRRNKLAVIIGSELDDIGDLVHDPLVQAHNPDDDYSKQAVTNAINHLYNLGVRYIFTVHLSDNKFGGTAVADSFLNFGNKFQNQDWEQNATNNYGWLQVEAAPAGDQINYWLFNDVQSIMHLFSPERRQELTDALYLSPVFPPALLQAVPEIFGTYLSPDVSAPVSGTLDACGALMGPMFAVFGYAVENPGAALAFVLPILGYDNDAKTKILNAHLLPLPDAPFFCPSYLTTNLAPYGVRNTNGLTPLGRFAVNEMMKRGMMLDVDHMAEKTVGDVFGIATNNLPSGPLNYPLNAGHNSFRELAKEATENHRTTNQLEIIRQLGGIMGVGWGNGDFGAFATNVPHPHYSCSSVQDDCAGTSKTFAQNYLYALEKLHGQHVCFGTDMDGFIVGPGPRFGPQAAFGLGDGSNSLRRAQINNQVGNYTGVRYIGIENPLMTAWNGRAVDPGFDTDSPKQGYVYNKAQAEFFATLSMFYWARTALKDQTQDYVDAIVDSFQQTLSPETPSTRHPKEYLKGMLHAMNHWGLGSACDDTDVATEQQLGAAIYLSRFANPPQAEDMDHAFQFIKDCDIWGNCHVNADKRRRYDDLVKVCNDYSKIFGPNTSMIRCQTGSYKQWDINFEGVAHYGLFPDFLQDLSNVGLKPQDLSVAFRSAEDFAQMWTRTLSASQSLLDQIAPSVPAGLTALAVASNQVQLSWSPSSDNPGGSGLGGYRVYRNDVFLATSAANSFLDSPVQPTSNYCYRVAAYDLVGNVSWPSTQVCLTPLTADSDGDGLPDWWTMKYFSHPTGQAGDHSRAQDDADGTGQNNLFKYVAGLDPTNPASVFTLRARAGGQPNQSQVIFSPRWTDRTYTVLFRTNLVSGGSWQNLTNASHSDNGAERTVTDLGATETTKYYRIQITYP